MQNTVAVPDSSGGRDGGPPLGFVCSWTDGGQGAAWVHVAGELDIAAVPQLERTLREPRVEARLVVLDLRELAFIDIAAVHAIVNASLHARRGGRRLVLVRGTPKVDRIFTLTGRSDGLEVGDLERWEPAVQVLLQLAGKDRLS
jgi:anti-sigma B factor antagonist